VWYQPSCKRRGGRGLVVEVPVHQERAAHCDLARLGELDLARRLRHADAAGLAFEIGVAEFARRTGLGRP